MSMNSGPLAMDLEALHEELVVDEALTGDEDTIENQRELSNSEYDELEEAVMQTARGRTFLREHAQRNRAVASDLVLRAMDDYRDQLKRQDFKQPSEILSAELQNMRDAISDTRRDIAAIKPKEGANNRIMAATEDLDAIVTSTERATNNILAAAERIQDACSALREQDADSRHCDTVEENVTDIFLACSFQDLTGQRTTKVVNALHYLEQRVGAMVQIWGSDSLRNGSEDDVSPAEEGDHAEAGLLNGPQMEGEGVAQDDIDQMFSEDIKLAHESIQTNDEAVDDGDPADDVDFDEPEYPPIMSSPEDRLLDDEVAGPTNSVEIDGSTETPSKQAVDAQPLEAGETDDDAPAGDADQDEFKPSGLNLDLDNDAIDAMFDS